MTRSAGIGIESCGNDVAERNGAAGLKVDIGARLKIPERDRAAKGEDVDIVGGHDVGRVSVDVAAREKLDKAMSVDRAGIDVRARRQMDRPIKNGLDAVETACFQVAKVDACACEGGDVGHAVHIAAAYLAARVQIDDKAGDLAEENRAD